MNSIYRILIVENNSETRDKVMSTLENEGYFVKVASDSDSATELNITFKPHLLIISLKIPEGNGFELAEKLKIRGGKFKVIFISSDEQSDEIKDVFRFGAAGYLVRPVKCKDLIEQVHYGIECLKIQETDDRYHRQLEKEVSERTVDISQTLEIAEYQSRQIDLLLNCMSEPLISIDFENKIMLLNAASEKCFGLNPCDCLGMNFSDYFTDHNLIRTVSSITNHFTDTGEAISVPSVVTKINDRIYSVSINILNNHIDKPSGCVLLFSDQTELYRSSQLRSGFLTLVAHEFRTPLTALLNGLNILKDWQTDKIIFLDVLDMINLSINRFSRLINNLLTFASVQRPDATPVVTTFSFVTLVNYVNDVLESSANEKKIEIIHIYDAEFDLIATDEQLLRNSLESIVDNAIKFSPINSTVNIRSSLLYSNGQHILKITIKDNGPGIPDTKLKNMFEWFTQGDERLSRNYRGVGIGLPLSLRAIEILRGTLDYSRNECGGSCFTLKVPVDLQE